MHRISQTWDVECARSLDAQKTTYLSPCLFKNIKLLSSELFNGSSFKSLLQFGMKKQKTKWTRSALSQLKLLIKTHIKFYTSIGHRLLNEKQITC